MIADLEEVDSDLSCYSDEVLSEFLDKFFAKKSMHYGGPIPKNHLHTPDNFRLLRYLSLKSAIDIIDDSLKEHRSQESLQQFFLTMQEKCFALAIPKHFVGGVLILYLRYCKGHDI